RQPGFPGVEDEVESFFVGELVDDRRQLLDELVLNFLLQLLDFGLRVLLETLHVDLLLLDILLELRARRVVEHAAAGLQLLLICRELLLPVGVLGLFLLRERVHTRERRLAFRRLLEHGLRVEERDLRASRERRRRLRRRLRSRCGGRLRGRGRLLRGLRRRGPPGRRPVLLRPGRDEG